MDIANKIQRTCLDALSGKFNRCEITVVLHVLQSDGGILAACLNATVLGLIDAGIPLVDLVCCCTVGMIDETAVLGRL